MKILLSNDDGVNAIGINFLNGQLASKHEVTIIAPDKERSSCGHGITLGDPLRLKQLDSHIFACSGLPADCVMLGLGAEDILPSRPDLVISGINHGANLGQDVYYSGTVAAAREAAFKGVKAVAISLVTMGIKDVEHFDVASEFIDMLLDMNLVDILPTSSVLNINVPNLKREKIAGIQLTTLGFQHYSEDVIGRLDRYGKKYYWVGGTYKGPLEIPGSDTEAISKGKISLSLINHSTSDSVGENVQRQLKDFLNDVEQNFLGHHHTK